MQDMTPGDWVSAGAAAVALVALFFTWGQARSARVQADSAKEQVALAKRQTEVQEQLYKDQQQPYLWVDYRMDEASGWIIDLVLKNEGPTVATDVRVNIDPPIERATDFKSWDLHTLPGFQDGFASIPPGREMRWTLGSHVDIFKEGALKRHEVTISFDGPYGPVPPVTYVLDYADGKSMAVREHGSLKAIAQALKDGNTKIVRSLGRIENRIGSDEEE